MCDLWLSYSLKFNNGLGSFLFLKPNMYIFYLLFMIIIPFKT